MENFVMSENRAGNFGDREREIVVPECVLVEGSLQMKEDILSQRQMHSGPTEGKRLITKEDVKNLIKSVGKPYTCDICPKCFTSSNGLAYHRMTHFERERFKCDYCSRTFSSFQYASIHMQAHVGKTQFKCEYCPKSFMSSQSVAIHMRTHTGEKPYKCTLCSKSFSVKQRLTIHEKLHKGERPFRCKECCADFITANDLNRHRRTHSTEQLLKCPYCSKSYWKKDLFDNHIISHELKQSGGDGSTYKCDVCPRTFAQQRFLLSHKWRHTMESKNPDHSDLLDESKKKNWCDVV